MSPTARESGAPRTVITTLLVTDLVDSTRLVDELGDERAAEVFGRQDRLARDLLVMHGGQEIDKTDGFLLLFGRPIDAVRYAQDYHAGLRGLSQELGVTLEARAGVHLGELIIKENRVEDIERGAKPVEVEGLAKPMAARIMSLALGRQTLMTRGAFDLARRAVVGHAPVAEPTEWLAYGAYLLKGCEEPVEVFEVGVRGLAPLRPPPDTDKAVRSVAAADEETLGWRPATGLSIPQRSGWVLQRKLGEGGFGEVWLGEHQRTHTRRVFKFCFDSAHLRSLKRELTLFRLLQETLGDRNDIARLYEVQLDEPPFFLESQFTQAGSLLDWVESQGGLERVSMDTRIDLVARTARAVAAAHSVGVLHKDIKPGNILIEVADDGSPLPRLADFGIGSLTNQEQISGNVTLAGFTEDLDDPDSATTRMYAPPELLAGKPFTVLGDVYALGVMLYQMVVGDLRRPIAESWERDVSSPVLRNDIHVCIDGNTEQRLGSAQGLAQRLETLPQRRRMLQRRRIARTAAFASGAMVVLLAVAVTWAVREGGLRRLAESRERESVESLNWLIEMFVTADVWDSGRTNPKEVRVVDILDEATRSLGERYEEWPEVKAGLRLTLGRLERNLAEYEQARANLAEALELSGQIDDPALRARAHHEWAALLFREGDHEQAEQHYQTALRIRRQLAAEAVPDDHAVFLDLADTIVHMSAVHRFFSKKFAAQAAAEEAIALREAHIDPSVTSQRRDLARAWSNLGVILRDQDEFGEAERLFRQALETYHELWGDEPYTDVAACKTNLGVLLMSQQRYTEAEPLFQDAVEFKRATDARDSLAISLTHLGELKLRLGDAAAARVVLDEAYDTFTDLLDATHWRVVATRHLIDGCRAALGETDSPLLTTGDPIPGDSLQPDLQRIFEFLAGHYRDRQMPERASYYDDVLARAGG